MIASEKEVTEKDMKGKCNICIKEFIRLKTHVSRMDKQ